MARSLGSKHRWTCPLCRQTIIGVHSITRHRDNLKKHPRDTSRCDFLDNLVLPGTNAQHAEDNVIRVPLLPATEIHAQHAEDNDIRVPLLPATDIHAQHNEDNVIRVALQPANIFDIARRPAECRTGTTGLVTRTRMQDRNDTKYSPTRLRNFIPLQKAWKHYISSVYEKCSPTFWSFFLPMHSLPASTIDTALLAARSAFNPPNALGRFPPTKRSLINWSIAKVDPFWPKVMCTATIDLRAFDLPPRLQTLTFRFVDPVWAWLQAATQQPAEEMNWIPKRKINPATPRDYYYGAGVEFGESFAEACRTCPSRTYPMLVGLHWDGAHAHGLNSSPICIRVGNTNSLSATTKYCIAYMPVLSDMGGAHASTAVEIKFSMKQQCIGAILRVLESAARTGVRCNMPTNGIKTTTMILWPRLISMNMDFPDARAYFGLLNQCCCSKCIRRKGRSAFRQGTAQSGSRIQTLYGIIENSTQRRMVRLAKEKLQRLGFNPDRRCRLTLICDRLLIRGPEHEDEVFPNVDFRDRMHGLWIFIHRLLFECFVNMKLPKETRVLLDKRLASVGQKRCIHDPNTGKSYRVQHTLFSEAHMSASDRMAWIVFLPHVIGHKALDFPEAVRQPLLTAVAYAQLFMICTTSKRPYNKRELHEIFDRGWIIFFGSMEAIHQHSFGNTYNKKMQKHRQNPLKHKAPKEFQRASRLGRAGTDKIIVCNDNHRCMQ